MSTLYNQFTQDLYIARKERNAAKVEALQSVIARIDNASAVSVSEGLLANNSLEVAGATIGLGSSEVERRELSEGEVLQLLIEEVEELKSAVVLIAESGHDSALDALQSKIAMLSGYLP